MQEYRVAEVAVELWISKGSVYKIDPLKLPFYKRGKFSGSQEGGCFHISSKYISYLLHIRSHILFKLLATNLLSTFRLYLLGQTK